ncbi:MAG TPA: hypothetical protein VHX68_01710 [Planctomycetaceae bacterium]|nr:hypothetical protein [Planctomycetaceae bacterium]
MNRSRSVSETSVGLFAFLDVLMSTMGSLILVLMVVTPKIRQESVAKAAVAAQRAAETRGAVEPKGEADKKPAPYVPPAVELPRETVDLNAKLKVQLAELSQEMQERRKVSEAKLEELGSAQASFQKNQAELDALEKRLEAILRAKRRLAESASKVSNEGVAVENELMSTATRLRTIRGQIALASTTYTFVAYDGVSGTTRRPILIECVNGQITFLQERIKLSRADVSGFSPAYNPLRAGAQALLDYWSTHSAPGDPRPYVLLVIRPSGTAAYYEARHLLERMKDPFGYELLPDNQKLDVPPPVPEAADACRKAVEKAFAERVDAFKDVFASGSGLGRSKLLAGSGTDPFAKALGGHEGGSPSPFDGLGNSPLGDSKGTSQTPGNTGGGQPGQLGGSASPSMGNGTSGGPNVAQLENGASGTGSTPTGSPGTGASGTGSSSSGTATPGTGTAGDRQAGVMLSDTGPLATGRTNAEAGGTSVMGIGTPGANSGSGVVRPGSGDGSGGGLLTGGLNGAGPSGVGTAPGGTGPGGPGSPSGAGMSGSPGPNSGGLFTGSPGSGTPGASGQGSTGPLGAAQGTPVVGSPVPGAPGTNAAAPGTFVMRPDGSSVGLPGNVGLSGNGSPGMGGPAPASPDSGFASTNDVPGTRPQGPASGASPSQSDFPPSIIPRAGGGDSTGLGSASDKLADGHPTPGVSSNETAEGQAESPAGPSDGLEPGSLPAAPQIGSSQSGQFGPIQSGSIHSGATQSGSSQFGSVPGGATDGGTGQVASDSTQSPPAQPSGSGTSAGGSNAQSDPGQVGGMPSFGSPEPTASGGDDGGSPSGSESSPGSKSSDGSSRLAANGDDYDAPRRASQQATYRWGISSPRASIGYEHDVRIYIERAQIYVGSQPPIPCGRGESSQRLELAVLRALNREAHTWGRPRENFYWVPSPQIVVCAGGLVQYERIQPAFERLSLNSTVEYRLELSRPSPLPRLVTE